MMKETWFAKLTERMKKHRPLPAAEAAQPKSAGASSQQQAQLELDVDALLCQMQNGHLEIPAGITRIPSQAFDPDVYRIAPGRKALLAQLVSVHVPGTVKSIGWKAFAGCAQLEEVVLDEGVESLEHNVFTDCKRLRTVKLPASIREICGWTFFGCGLKEPVFAADGRMLAYFPQNSDWTAYIVPEGVEEIGVQAFLDAKRLTHVQLPRSLRRIRERAFIDCGFSEVTIPAGVRVEYGAFCHCEALRQIHFEDIQDPLEAWAAGRRAQGHALMDAAWMKTPQASYWKEADFCDLARRCARADLTAMEQMVDYFAQRASQAPDVAFYQYAQQFWRVRAYRFGSKRSEAYLRSWIQENPKSRLVSPGISEELCGTAYGDLLNALGFLFFEPAREYTLGGVDAQGVVEVSSYESEEGPDEDGYGREDYYDWWYLDGCLNLPKGVGFIHSFSHHDKRNNERRFKELHDQAAQSAGKWACAPDCMQTGARA